MVLQLKITYFSFIQFSHSAFSYLNALNFFLEIFLKDKYIYLTKNFIWYVLDKRVSKGM